MAVQETSRAAYEEVRSTLTERHVRVLTALAQYRERRGQWPTAYELYEAMHAAGTAKDLNDVRPRLTELKERGRVENPTVKRHCSVTSKRAFTWRLTETPTLF